MFIQLLSLLRKGHNLGLYGKENPLSVCTYHIPFLLVGHLGWLHNVTVMNRAAVNTDMQGSL